MTTRKSGFSEIKKTILLLRQRCVYRHVALSLSAGWTVAVGISLGEWLHFTRIPAFVSLPREPSAAAELRATRTFFGDNTRHNRARRTSAHTNGVARRLPWSEDSRCCSPTRSFSFHVFVRHRKTYQPPPPSSLSSSNNPASVIRKSAQRLAICEWYSILNRIRMDFE